MPWTHDSPPDSMKNLPAKVKNKAVDIANALYKDGNHDDGSVIAIAISQAKKWAKHNESQIKNVLGQLEKMSLKEASPYSAPGIPQTDDRDVKIGEAIIDLLHLQPKQKIGMNKINATYYETAYGPKTAKGLGQAVMHVIGKVGK